MASGGKKKRFDGVGNHVWVREKQKRHRWKGTQHQLQSKYLRQNSGQRKNKQAAVTLMMLIAQDSKPVALTLLPVPRVTRKHWRGG